MERPFHELLLINQPQEDGQAVRNICAGADEMISLIRAPPQHATLTQPNGSDTGSGREGDCASQAGESETEGQEACKPHRKNR